ncbi:MAG: response regulator [Hyphomicrobium sp.]
MISIVDDDESVRDATASLMRAAGYAPKAFPCATDFLNSADVKETKFLIADVQMPGMTGIELHDRLVGAGMRIPTVLITAYPDARPAPASAPGGCCWLPHEAIRRDRASRMHRNRPAVGQHPES